MKNKIYITNSQKDIDVSMGLRALIRRAVNGALKYEGVDYECEVSVTLTDADSIRELNAEYRDKDAVTDVLSFPMFDDPEESPCMLGDIVLCLSRAAEQAVEFGHTFEREVAFLTVHSVLHLLGYDHETGEEDEKEMFDKQKEIMDFLEIRR